MLSLSQVAQAVKPETHSTVLLEESDLPGHSIAVAIAEIVRNLAIFHTF